MTTGGVFFVANLEHPPFTDFFLSEATPPSSLTFRYCLSFVFDHWCRGAAGIVRRLAVETEGKAAVTEADTEGAARTGEEGGGQKEEEEGANNTSLAQMTARRLFSLSQALQHIRDTATLPVFTLRYGVYGLFLCDLVCVLFCRTKIFFIFQLCFSGETATTISSLLLDLLPMLRLFNK